MKHKKLCLFIIMAIGICCLFTACKKQTLTALDTPKNIRIENNLLV